MRTTFIVAYDICDPKRLRRVFKICRNHGNHLQYSVFECDLLPAEKVTMMAQLREVIDSRVDQILFIPLGPAEARGSREIEALGTAYINIDEPCYVF